jgi:hypothetical protein
MFGITKRRLSRYGPVLLVACLLTVLASGCGQGNGTSSSSGPAQHNGDILFSKNFRLYLMRPDGTHLRPIPGLPRDVTDASFWPDGSAFCISADDALLGQPLF